MLLSKALRMQQDLEDKKNKIIIKGLENKIKDYEASLEKKDFLLQAMEGSLAEAQAENARLNKKLLQKSESFEQERKDLQTKYEAEADKKYKTATNFERASEHMIELRQPLRRLKRVFNSVGASSEEFTPSAENIPSTFEHI
jgi:peptidoglycan hydrolase CwlO-like protein